MVQEHNTRACVFHSAIPAKDMAMGGKEQATWGWFPNGVPWYLDALIVPGVLLCLALDAGWEIPFWMCIQRGKPPLNAPSNPQPHAGCLLPCSLMGKPRVTGALIKLFSNLTSTMGASVFRSLKNRACNVAYPHVPCEMTPLSTLPAYLHRVRGLQDRPVAPRGRA